MGLSTRLGPWLLGTVKNTTGTTAGTIRNMGATSVGQTAPVTSADAATTTAFVIPAGSILTNVTIVQTTKFTGTSGVITVYNNGTAFAASAAITAGASGNIALSASTDAQAALWNNVGTTDAIITYTMASSGSLAAGAGTLLIEYIVRNSDGTYLPTSYQA